MRAIPWTLFVLLPLLGGCVVFEHNPVDQPKCNPNLAGNWMVVGGDLLEDRNASSIQVDAACTVQWHDLQDGRRVHFKALGFDHHGYHYLTLSSADVLALLRLEQNQSLDTEGGAEAAEGDNSVMLLRYQLQGDEFTGEIINPDAVERLIDKGELKGTKEGSSIVVQESPFRLRRWLTREPGVFGKGREGDPG
ncbi:hypothetical protein [Pseudoxanthomonas sp. CF125]|uniref:hypothetical protein n=1 Tax=Pseudoxanthomonas sp. CF125 TaxID=1855303 RepID=UPI00088766FA|nr:hypothetical protein [Pseudoxanthomonas sp. CF125]SDQ61681.1 hypothetical protein SAMN05216569_1828 [Pseudoxanthomonas sp. CF125]